MNDMHHTGCLLTAVQTTGSSELSYWSPQYVATKIIVWRELWTGSSKVWTCTTLIPLIRTFGLLHHFLFFLSTGTGSLLRDRSFQVKLNRIKGKSFVISINLLFHFWAHKFSLLNCEHHHTKKQGKQISCWNPKKMFHFTVWREKELGNDVEVGKMWSMLFHQDAERLYKQTAGGWRQVSRTALKQTHPVLMCFQTWDPTWFQPLCPVYQLTFSSCASATPTTSMMTRRLSLCSPLPSTPSRRSSRWVSDYLCCLNRIKVVLEVKRNQSLINK